METRTSKDVPEARLDLASAIKLTEDKMNSVIGEMKRADDIMAKAGMAHLQQCFKYGHAIIESLSIFRANGHTNRVFYGWLSDYTGKGKSTLMAYVQVARNEKILGNATGFDDARALLKEGSPGKDGVLATPKNGTPSAPVRLTDAKRIIKIETEIARLDDVAAASAELIAKIQELSKAGKDAICKEQATRAA